MKRIVVVTLGTLLLLTGCSGIADDAQKYMDKHVISITVPLSDETQLLCAWDTYKDQVVWCVKDDGATPSE